MEVTLITNFFRLKWNSSQMNLSEYKLCLNDGILDSRINSFQETFFSQKWHILTFYEFYELYNIKF